MWDYKDIDLKSLLKKQDVFNVFKDQKILLKKLELKTKKEKEKE